MVSGPSHFNYEDELLAIWNCSWSLAMLASSMARLFLNSISLVAVREVWSLLVILLNVSYDDWLHPPSEWTSWGNSLEECEWTREQERPCLAADLQLEDTHMVNRITYYLKKQRTGTQKHWWKYLLLDMITILRLWIQFCFLTCAVMR